MTLTRLTERFIEKVEKENTNLRQLAKTLVIPYDRLYKWSQGKSNPKAPDDKKVEGWIDGKILNNLQDLPIVEHDSISDLTRANILLAEAHKIFAEANLKLATTNQELTQMVKGSANAPKGSELLTDAIRMDLLELLADVASGKRFDTRRQALGVINNIVHGKKSNVPLKDIQKS